MEQLAVECVVWRSIRASESHIIIGNESKVGGESGVDSPGVKIPFLPCLPSHKLRYKSLHVDNIHVWSWRDGGR